MKVKNFRRFCPLSLTLWKPWSRLQTKARMPKKSNSRISSTISELISPLHRIWVLGIDSFTNNIKKLEHLLNFSLQNGLAFWTLRL